MKVDADVIIPVTTATAQTYLMAVMSLRTCHASTSARIWAVINNSPDSIRKRRLITQCQMLEINVRHWDKPFSLPRIFNAGTDWTTGQYIVHATSDVIFYPNWLENIIELWKEHPEYYTLGNYSFDDENMPCVEHAVVNERRVVDTHNPSAGLNVFRRKDGFRWDENYVCWEMDADLLYFLQRRKLKAGYCLNARADHLIDCVKCDIQQNWRDVEAGKYLRKKWGLEEPK